MKRALSECEVSGLKTNLTFLERLVSSVEFESGVYDTGTIEARTSDWLSTAGREGVADDAAVAMLVASLMDEERPRASAPMQSGPSAWVSAHRRRRVGL
jgi:acetyl/propionyl-CoA carboxylase alpha subunit